MVLRGILIGLVSAAAILAACGSAKLAGPGGDCFVTTDCQAGLVCVPQKNNTSKCSTDLANIAGQIPPEASVKDTGGEAAPPGDGGAQEPKDGGNPVLQPDTGGGGDP